MGDEILTMGAVNALKEQIKKSDNVIAHLTLVLTVLTAILVFFGAHQFFMSFGVEALPSAAAAVIPTAISMYYVNKKSLIKDKDS